MWLKMKKKTMECSWLKAIKESAKDSPDITFRGKITLRLRPSDADAIKLLEEFGDTAIIEFREIIVDALCYLRTKSIPELGLSEQYKKGIELVRRYTKKEQSEVKEILLDALFYLHMIQSLRFDDRDEKLEGVIKDKNKEGN